MGRARCTVDEGTYTTKSVGYSWADSWVSWRPSGYLEWHLLGEWAGGQLMRMREPVAVGVFTFIVVLAIQIVVYGTVIAIVVHFVRKFW